MLVGAIHQAAGKPVYIKVHRKGVAHWYLSTGW